MTIRFVRPAEASQANRAFAELLDESRAELMERVTACAEDKKARMELAVYAGILAQFFGSAISSTSGGSRKRLEACLEQYLKIAADHAREEFEAVTATMPAFHEGPKAKQ